MRDQLIITEKSLRVRAILYKLKKLPEKFWVSNDSKWSKMARNGRKKTPRVRVRFRGLVKIVNFVKIENDFWRYEGKASVKKV